MKKIALAVTLLLAATNAMLAMRLFAAGIRPAEMQPRVQYFVTLQMSADLHSEQTRVRVFIPKDSDHQRIVSERVESHLFAYELGVEGENRLAIWSAEGVSGHENALYDVIVDTRPQRFALPSGVAVPDAYPTEVQRFLEPSENIQSDAPEIAAQVERLLPPKGQRVLAASLRTLFNFVQNEIAGSDYENTLDALTTLKWREAFCGGKSRLLVSLLRAAGIPARLAGGLILNPGSKRTTHVWAEAWIHGVWVPFDALNRHFAEMPGHYLVLYHGDRTLFKRSRHINFSYVFNIKKWRTPPAVKSVEGRLALLNAYVFWEPFRKAHISLNLLRIILLLPIGVLIVLICRNVIGLTTFGTFHPALLAVAFRGSGLAWGVGLYLSVLLLGLGLRAALERVQLLHTARLAILLSAVVVFMVCVTYASVQVGVLEPAHVSMFPIAILTITIESFFVKAVEMGTRPALFVMLQTLAVITAVYIVLDSDFLQTLVFGFPELLLAVAASYLVLGRFVGMRLSEYRRFHWLMAG